MPFPIFNFLVWHHTNLSTSCAHSPVSAYWNNSPANFVSRFKSIVPVIPNKLWFKDLTLSGFFIIKFNRLLISHYLSSAHTCKLNLNNLPLCTLHLEESICDLSYILFNCPSLSIKRLILLNPLKSLSISFNISDILNSNSKPAIILIISIIHEAGFLT